MGRFKIEKEEEEAKRRGERRSSAGWLAWSGVVMDPLGHIGKR